LKSFILNRHGSLVLPANFFPEIDFSSLENARGIRSRRETRIRTEGPTGQDLRDDVFLPLVTPLERGGSGRPSTGKGKEKRR